MTPDNVTHLNVSPEAHVRAALARIDDPGERLGLLLMLFHEEFRHLQESVHSRSVYPEEN